MKVELYRIIKLTAGKFHCWCESSVGRIRKPNSAVPNHLWDEFNHKPIPVMEKEPTKAEIRLGWLQRFWNWIKRIFKSIWLHN